MMKFKKFLAAAMTGAMMFGTIAAAVPSVHVYAAGEDTNTTQTTLRYKVDINYSDFTATIYSTDNKDKYVVLEVLKDESGSKVSGTYPYEVKTLTLKDNTTAYGVIVDLSFLKPTKACYIRAYGNTETAPTGKTGIITVNPQGAKFSMKYTGGKTANEWYKAFNINKSEVSDVNVLDAYEFRTLYGSNFKSLKTDFDASTTEIAGTTIVVRKKAVDEKKDANTVLASASPEVKVKISAAPKAPKVTVDYVKQSIKLPKNCSVAVIYSTGATTEKVLHCADDLYVQEAYKDIADEEVLNANFEVKIVSDVEKVVQKEGSDTEFYVYDEETDTYTKVTDFTSILAIDDTNDPKTVTYQADKELYIEMFGYDLINLDDYFTIVEGTGTNPDTSQKKNDTDEFYKLTDEENETYTKVTDLTCVTVITETVAANSVLTEWQPYAAGGAVDQETILKLFNNIKANNQLIKDLTASGFSLLVRTQKTNKPASAPAFVSVKGVDALQLTSGKNELKLGSNTLSWEAAENNGKKGYKFTVSGNFQYEKETDKWTALKNNFFVEVTGDKEFKVRTTGVKVDKNDPTKAAFPSETYTIKLAPATTTLTVEPATKTIKANVSDLPTLVVKAGSETVTAADIEWAVKKGTGESAAASTDLKVEGGVVKAGTGVTTLENGAVYVLTGTVKSGDYKDKTVTVTLTVEAAETPAPAQKMATPTIDVATGAISVESTKAATISRNTSNNLIHIADGAATAVIEYSIDGGTSWVAVTDSTSDISDSADVISIRFRTKAADSKDASEILTVGVPANLTVADGAVKNGTDTILTLARKNGAPTTITFTAGEGVNVATLEYKGGTKTEWTAISASAEELENQDNTEDNITFEVRIKAEETSKSIASNPATVSLAKVE